MAITDINLSGHVRDDAGTAVNGITVYLLETAASLGGTQETTTTTDSNGAWTFTEQSLDATYDIKITSGGQNRYIPWSDEITLKTVDTSVMKIRGVAGAAAPLYFFADRADDAGDGWRINVTDHATGTFAIGSDKAVAGTIIDYITITNGANAAASLTTILGQLTIGVDDTGADVKFFGATSGQYLLWDESADELVLAGDTKLSFHDAAGGENIIASANGHLEVNAGTTLDVTAPTVDINASTAFTVDTAGISLDSSGASNLTTSGGALTITSAAAATWSTGAGALTVNGTAGINLQEGGSTIISISDARVLATTNTASVDLDASGAIQVNSSGGAISVANDNVDQTVNLATAGTRTLNIGINDGTDATTIASKGNVTQTGTITVGVDGTGYDVKFFGATASAYLLWDESADKLLTAGGAVVDIVKDKLLIGGTAVTTTAAELNIVDGGTSATGTTLAAADRVVVNDNGTMVQVAMSDFETFFEGALDTLTAVTSILATDLKMGEDDQTKIDFETADEIHFYAANAHEVTLAANELSPNTSDGIALGTTSKMWSDLFLASGAVVNFNNGDVTLTHSSNTITVAGGTLAAAAITGTTIDASTDFTVGDLVITNGVLTDSTGLSIAGDVTLTGTTPTLTFDAGSAEDTAIIFDGAAQEFHIGLMDDTDFLTIGTGTTLNSSTGYINLSAAAELIGIFGAPSDAADIKILYGARTTSAGSPARFLLDDAGEALTVPAGATRAAMLSISGPTFTMADELEIATTVYIASAASATLANSSGSADYSYALLVQTGVSRFGGGTLIGNTTSLNNLIDDASGGSGSTTLYIGNESITTSSDERLKTDIRPTAINALSLVDQFKVVDFAWDDPTDTVKYGKNYRGRYTGMIAQDTIKIAPWIINDQGGGRDCDRCMSGDECDDHGMWHVEYAHLVPTLVKAIQELKQKIEELEHGNR